MTNLEIAMEALRKIMKLPYISTSCDIAEDAILEIERRIALGIK